MKICRGNRPMYAAYTRIFMNHGYGTGKLSHNTLKYIIFS